MQICTTLVIVVVASDFSFRAVWFFGCDLICYDIGHDCAFEMRENVFRDEYLGQLRHNENVNINPHV